MEAVRQDRRIYVLVRWPEDPSDEVLLYRAWDQIDELKSEVFRLKKVALKLAMERDEASNALSSSREKCLALQDTNEWLMVTCERMRRLSKRIGLAAVVLLGLLIVSVLVQTNVLT